MVEFINYYKILQVDCSADLRIIEAAFKKLSSIYHPDVNKDTNAEEKYKIITEAYFVLKDPEKRKRYDEKYSKFNAKDENTTNTSSKNSFLKNIDILLDGYELAVIKLEETYLVKLKELSDKLRNISYPSDFSNERNGLVDISEKICYYQQLAIQCMKNDDFKNYKINNEEYENALDRLFSYYKSLI